MVIITAVTATTTRPPPPIPLLRDSRHPSSTLDGVRFLRAPRLDTKQNPSPRALDSKCSIQSQNADFMSASSRHPTPNQASPSRQPHNPSPKPEPSHAISTSTMHQRHTESPDVCKTTKSESHHRRHPHKMSPPPINHKKNETRGTKEQQKNNAYNTQKPKTPPTFA